MEVNYVRHGPSVSLEGLFKWFKHEMIFLIPAMREKCGSMKDFSRFMRQNLTAMRWKQFPMRERGEAGLATKLHR